jgi:hypothetical protein
MRKEKTKKALDIIFNVAGLRLDKYLLEDKKRKYFTLEFPDQNTMKRAEYHLDRALVNLRRHGINVQPNGYSRLAIFAGKDNNNG